MADFNLTNVPDSVPATVEGYAFYFCTLYWRLYGQKEFREVPNADMTRMCEVSQGVDADGLFRTIFRPAFLMDTDILVANASSSWAAVKEIAEASVPPAYLKP